MACRNLEKSRQAQQEIIKITKNYDVDLLQLDVSSFKSIADFCSGFKKSYGRLDVLINNAGYFNHGEKDINLAPIILNSRSPPTPLAHF